MRVALDKDTYNLLADGIVKLLRALAAVEQPWWPAELKSRGLTADPGDAFLTGGFPARTIVHVPRFTRRSVEHARGSGCTRRKLYCSRPRKSVPRLVQGIRQFPARVMGQYRGLSFYGRIAYAGHQVDILVWTVDEIFIKNPSKLVLRPSAPEPPRRVPSPRSAVSATFPRRIAQSGLRRMPLRRE